MLTILVNYITPTRPESRSKGRARPRPLLPWLCWGSTPGHVGETYVPSVLVSESGSLGDGDINSNRQLANLTRREQDVLSRLVRGYSNKRIANEIGTKEITVAFHLRGVFKKLGVSNRTEAVASSSIPP